VPKLSYFYFESCPFRRMVNQVIEQLNIKVEYCNIHADEKAFELLHKTTGKTMVPCLFIDGKALFESADIVAWLKDNAERLEKI
jgi:glutaredoxin 3